MGEQCAREDGGRHSRDCQGSRHLLAVKVEHAVFKVRGRVVDNREFAASTGRRETGKSAERLDNLRGRGVRLRRLSEVKQMAADARHITWAARYAVNLPALLGQQTRHLSADARARACSTEAESMTTNAGKLGHCAGTPAATKCSTGVGLQPVTTATGAAAKEHKRRLPISVHQALGIRQTRPEFVFQIFSPRAGVWDKVHGLLMAFFWRVQESPTFWGSDYEDYLVQQEAEASSLTRNLYQLVFEDPCEEIDLILRDCLLASQTEGNPDCFEAATPAESDECWCQTCDFERAITICRQPSIYQQCAPCQMGRTPRAWGSARCRDGRRGSMATADRYGTATAADARVKAKANPPNPLAGRRGVTEERWRGDVRSSAHERASEQAREALRSSGQEASPGPGDKDASKASMLAHALLGGREHAGASKPATATLAATPPRAAARCGWQKSCVKPRQNRRMM